MTIKTETTLIRNILYLLQTIENGKMSITAEQNGIKISNLSKLIKELEEHFNTKLLIRKSNGVIPTEDGQVLLSLAQELETSLEKLQQLKDKQISEIKIFIKKDIDIDLSHIKINTKIIKTNEEANCDIAISDNSFTYKNDFKKSPITIKNNIISTKLFLYYKDIPTCENICKQIKKLL